MPPAEVVAVWHPWLLLGEAVLGGLAVAAARAAERPVPPARVLAVLAALAAVYAALGSPLDAAADSLFSAHMLEHAILTLAAAPLLVLARPLWLLPGPLRAIASGLVRRMARPPAGLILFDLTYAVYHLPQLYQAGLADEVVHSLEHAALVATATLMWWPVCGPERDRLAPLRRLRYLLAAGLAMVPLCAGLAFAGRPLYPAYTLTSGLWGLTPLHDQQLGALIMMLAATVAFDLAALAAFLTLAEGEPSRPGRRGATRVPREAG